jgi:hypothetical protein
MHRRPTGPAPAFEDGAAPVALDVHLEDPHSPKGWLAVISSDRRS